MSDDAEQASLDEVVEESAEEGDAEEDTEDGFAYHMEQKAFGELPDGWDFAKSEEMLEYIRSGISDSQNGDDEGIPVTRIETISDGVVNYEKVGYVEVDDESDYSDDKLQRGDLLFSNINSREEIGKTAIYKGEEELYHGMNLLRIRYDTEVANPWYTYFVYDSLMSQDVFFRMSKAAVGQSSINQSQMGNYHIPLPPLSEQLKIASVLYNVDEAIRKTEEIIEGTKRVKKGVMQEVFTEGYYEHDELEETRIGRIPEAWELGKVKDYVELISGAHVKSDLVSDDESLTPYLTGPEDFDEFGFTVTKYTDEPTKFCEPDDTLVTVKGSGCGKSTFADQRACISRQLKALRPKDGLEPLYLFYFVKTEQNFLETLAEGSAIPGLSNSHLTTLDIPVPSIEEQRKIADALRRFDHQIEKEQEYADRLHRLKRALMQDLLTGEVRTKDRDIEVLPEVEAHG